MILKWIGALLVVVGCGGFGFAMAAAYRREIQMLSQLVNLLEFMECELEYRITPLPALFYKLSEQSTGQLKAIFHALAKEMEEQISPDAKCCMDVVLSKTNDLPNSVRSALVALGDSLGRFDLDGQMKEIAAVKLVCASNLEVLRSQKDNRVRSYQTLGLCAGAALAILFF